MHFFFHFGMVKKFMKKPGVGQTNAVWSPWCLPLGLFYGKCHHVEKVLP